MKTPRPARFALVVCFLALAAATAGAQTRKLNGPLATAYVTHVTRFEFGANGVIAFQDGFGFYVTPADGSAPARWIADYTGRLDGIELTPDASQLVWYSSIGIYVVPTDGTGSVRQLLTLVPGNESIYYYRLSPDGQRVVYLKTTGPGSSNTGLFSLPIDGSQPPIELQRFGTYGLDNPLTTADSARVVFRWSGSLFTVPIDGALAPVSITPGATFARGVSTFALSPSGTRVVYRADLDTDDVVELYSAPADGSGLQVKLSPPLGADRDVDRFAISPDSTSVAYVADQSGDNAWGLYQVPIDGGAIVTLDPGIAGRSIFEVAISSVVPRAVYRTFSGSGDADLYGVALDGSEPAVKLNPAVRYMSFRLDTGSARVVFDAAMNTDFGRLYSAPIDGSMPAVRLDPTPDPQQGVAFDAFVVGAGRVGFLEGGNIFSAPIDGSSAAIQLHPGLAGAFVARLELGPSGQDAAYVAYHNGGGQFGDLYWVPLDGSRGPELRSTAPETFFTVGTISNVTASANGKTVLYRAHQEDAEDVFRVDLAGDPTPPVPLGIGYTSSFALTSDSARCVYLPIDRSRFFWLPLDGSSGPIAGSALALGSSRWSWQLAPDSNRMVQLFYTNPYLGAPQQIFGARVDGASAPVELNVPRAVSGAISTVAISPDSTRVVYAGVQETQEFNGKIELFSAPIDGSAPRVKLNGVLAGNVVVPSLYLVGPTISPDSSRVVYLADRDSYLLSKLFSVPIDGSSPPVELSALPAPDRDVTTFAVSPDATRVVYVSDQDQNDVFKLYSVALAGGSAVELSAITAPDRDVDPTTYVYNHPFLISPRSAWVVYRSDQDADEVYELYRAPLAGGSAPVRLTHHASLLRLIAISADDRFVVYARTASEGTSLWSVPLQGGRARLLSGSMPVTISQYEPGVTLDAAGRWVLFQAEAQPGLRELFAAPIGGEFPALRVNGELASGPPSGASGAFLPRANAVLYQAEQDQDGVVELYLREFVPTWMPHTLRR